MHQNQQKCLRHLGHCWLCRIKYYIFMCVFFLFTDHQRAPRGCREHHTTRAPSGHRPRTKVSAGTTWVRAIVPFHVYAAVSAAALSHLNYAYDGCAVCIAEFVAKHDGGFHFCSASDDRIGSNRIESFILRTYLIADRAKACLHNSYLIVTAYPTFSAG